MGGGGAAARARRRGTHVASGKHGSVVFATVRVKVAPPVVASIGVRRRVAAELSAELKGAAVCHADGDPASSGGLEDGHLVVEDEAARRARPIGSDRAHILRVFAAPDVTCRELVLSEGEEARQVDGAEFRGARLGRVTVARRMVGRRRRRRLTLVASRRRPRQHCARVVAAEAEKISGEGTAGLAEACLRASLAPPPNLSFKNRTCGKTHQCHVCSAVGPIAVVAGPLPAAPERTSTAWAAHRIRNLRSFLPARLRQPHCSPCWSAHRQRPQHKLGT